MATRSKKHKGRKAGSRNKGFFYRAGRGWCASEGTRAIPLTRVDGTRIREADAPIEVVKEAYARFTLAKGQPVPVDKRDQITVMELCQLYLDKCKVSRSDSTFNVRADALFDFCHGLPASMRDKTGSGKKPTKQEMEAARIHKGFANVLVTELLPLHIDQWIAAHPNWDGGQRTKIQAIKRALNYGVEAGVLSKNPIRGYKIAKSNIRKTYITPEQEEACYKYANPALAMAIRVCIRTGARYGCEFAKLTAKHITFDGDRMEWRFAPKESKTKKLRILRISDAGIIAIVREQLKKYPTGPIFRNTVGGPWKQAVLKGAFSDLRKRLAKKGLPLDDDACMYSCRHTYAKRTLAGYWTDNKKTNIETLSQLMGNSREVCWQHYADWCDTYTDPLWDAA